MAAATFPTNPTNGQIATVAGRQYVYNSTYGTWKNNPQAYPLVDTYATPGDLPLSGNQSGDQAFVSSTNRLYIWNGTGWYNIALINTSPSITGGYNSNYLFETDGTPIEITLIGSDPEGIPLTWSYEVTSGSLTNGGGTTATISNVDNVFTITPSTNEDYSGYFELTFKASDGVNLGTAASSFFLSFALLFPTFDATKYSGTGSTIVDSTTAFTGTINAGITFNSSGNYFEADGTSTAYITLPNEAGQYPYQDFSAFACVRINSYGNASEHDGTIENRLVHINGANSSTSSNRGGWTTDILDGYPHILFGDTSSTVNILTSTTRLNLNQWYLLIFTRNKTTGEVQIYINDESTPTDTSTLSTLDVKMDGFGYDINAATFGKYLINTFPYTYGFKGDFAFFGFADTVLSSTDKSILKAMASRLGVV